ncbi:ROK family protein [Paenibacillus soyae]|uniref:ROK family protein n=1 Tax=Paenibacillus soyae TaxID=2969249 RepID=A0A9X2MYN7_9BACL|nr:ROK family protein [Paenibacillus soyae]MCR2805917.1 ROK family protein [Paenibacillus soyae]
MNSYIGVEIDAERLTMLADGPDDLIVRTAATGRECELQHIVYEVEHFVADLPYVPSGIGIGMPGLVVGTDKVELSHVIPALSGATADLFAKRTGLPVAFINDAKASTLAEAAHYPDRDTIAVVMIDTFIASGVVVRGDLLLGAKGWSGEFGYMIMTTADGQPKPLDLLASGYAIAHQSGLDAASISQKLADGDAQLSAIVREAGAYLGYALANLLHLYNPDALVIGGSTARLPGYMEEAINKLEAHALPELFKCCSIASPKSSQYVTAFGAREWIRKLISSPDKA